MKLLICNVDSASDCGDQDQRRKISVFKKLDYSISSGEAPNDYQEEEKDEGFVEVAQPRGRLVAHVAA